MHARAAAIGATARGDGMTALRRTARIRLGQMPPLDLQTICDKCNKSRAHGNHQKCSKQRQAEGIARRADDLCQYLKKVVIA